MLHFGYLQAILTLLWLPACILSIVVIGLASTGKTFGIRRFYAGVLIKIFEVNNLPNFFCFSLFTRISLINCWSMVVMKISQDKLWHQLTTLAFIWLLGAINPLYDAMLPRQNSSSPRYTNNYTVSLNHPAFVNKRDVTSHDSFKARFWKVGQYHMRKRDWKCIYLRSSAHTVARWRSESEETPAEKITKIGGR